MFGLCVRFTCRDTDSAAGFDHLVAQTVPAIRKDEPGTLIYAVHKVEGQPLQRVFYELYRDRTAFDAHEEQAHTRAFLAERERYLASVEVDFLALQVGKGTGGWATAPQVALGRELADGGRTQKSPQKSHRCTSQGRPHRFPTDVAAFPGTLRHPCYHGDVTTPEQA
jgi:quinol monooxygenase YgiN